MTHGQIKLLRGEFVVGWFSKIYRQVQMRAYVTNALAACNTSKLTLNLQSMSHRHHSRPAQYQTALTYIERWFIFSNHRKMVSKLLSLNRCEENHDDIGTISRFDINWSLCFSVLVLNITILWTILGLRKIVHHHPLDTDKILFVSNWASFL